MAPSFATWQTTAASRRHNLNAMGTYQQNRDAIEQALDAMTAVGAPALERLTGKTPANPKDPAELIGNAMDWAKSSGDGMLSYAGTATPLTGDITFKRLDRIRRIRNAAAHRLPEIGDDDYVQQSLNAIKGLTRTFRYLDYETNRHQRMVIAHLQAENQRHRQRYEHAMSEVQRWQHLAEGRRSSLAYREAEAHRLKPIAQQNMNAVQRWEAEAKRWQAEAERLLPIAQQNFRAAEQKEADALKWRCNAAFYMGQCHQLTDAPDNFAARNDQPGDSDDWKIGEAYYQGRAAQANANKHYASAHKYQHLRDHASQMAESTTPPPNTGPHLNQSALDDMIPELVPELADAVEAPPQQSRSLRERLGL